MQEPLRPECSKRFSQGSERQAVLEEKFKGMDDKLDIIVENTSNHLSELGKDVRELRNRMWLVLAAAGAVGGGGIYGIVELVR